jgi:hypothetical protein
MQGVFKTIFWVFVNFLQIFQRAAERKTAAPDRDGGFVFKSGAGALFPQNSPASQPASGMYKIGRNIAGSILPPRQSTL